MRPTAPDRERLASGIELAQHLAEAVKEAQQQVLDRHLGTVKQQERKFFADMQSQKKYEQVRVRSIPSMGWRRQAQGRSGKS